MGAARVGVIFIAPVSLVLCLHCESLRGGVASSEGDAEAGAAPAAPLRFCATATPPPDFCADFDEGDPEEGFENAKAKPEVGVLGGGTIAADTNLDISKDQTRSIAFGLPALISSSSNAGAYLLKILPFVPREIIFQMDVRVATEELPWDTNLQRSGKVTLVGIDFGRTGTCLVYRENLGWAMIVFDGNTPRAPVPLRQPFPVGQWKQLMFFLYNQPMEGGPEGRLDVFIDGIRAGSTGVPASFQSVTSAPVLEIGAPTAQGPMGPFRDNVDNVRVTWKK